MKKGRTDCPEQMLFGYRGELTISGLIHLRNRDYDPSSGTFTSVDPIDGDDGLTTVANAYNYTNNDPLNLSDPLGTNPDECLFQFFGCSLLPALRLLPIAQAQGCGVVDTNGDDLGCSGFGKALGELLALAAVFAFANRQTAAAMSPPGMLLNTFEDASGLNIPGSNFIFGGGGSATTDIELLQIFEEEIREGDLDLANQSAFRRALGGKKGDECAAHHIVAKAHPRAEAGREVLIAVNIGINSIANGALINGKGHAKLHTFTEGMSR